MSSAPPDPEADPGAPGVGGGSALSPTPAPRPDPTSASPETSPLPAGEGQGEGPSGAVIPAAPRLSVGGGALVDGHPAGSSVEEAGGPASGPDSSGAAAPPRPGTAAAVGGWVRVIAAAVVFAVGLRVLGFEAYRIPSTSMEDTLLVGDFVLVSKLHYGARVLGRRLPGFDDPDRGDVAVFNYPPSRDPVIRRRTPYIKRILGLPGDTLSVRDKTVYIGAHAVPSPVAGRRLWAVQGRIPPAPVLDSLGLAGRVERAGPGLWVASATRPEAEALAMVDGVDSLAPYLRPPGDGSAAFPAARRYSLDDYGPIVVPSRGMTLALTDDALPTVREVLERFEHRRIERTVEGFLVDGRPAETVTFGQDYYFVMGDSRDDSADSRTWGFVPFDHVIGKAIGVYFSWDDDAGRPRWGRIGRGIGR